MPLPDLPQDSWWSRVSVEAWLTVATFLGGVMMVLGRHARRRLAEDVSRYLRSDREFITALASEVVRQLCEVDVMLGQSRLDAAIRNRVDHVIHDHEEKLR